MKNLLILICFVTIILSACHKKRVVSRSGVEEPMYKTDRRVEEYRENSGMKNTSKDHAMGDGSGSSYSSYGSRQEILNAMAKKDAQKKSDSLNQISNINSYTISDTATIINTTK